MLASHMSPVLTDPYCSTTSLTGLDSPVVHHLDFSSTSSSSSLSSSKLRHSKSTTSLTSVNKNLRLLPMRNSTAFQPLPPIPKISSLRLSFSDLFPSTQSPPIQSPDQIQSSSTISHQAVEDCKISIPDPSSEEVDSSPNDPYTPWPNHIRPLIISPPSPSEPSRYSRPLSRSGARAPEPPERRKGIKRHLLGHSRWRNAKRNIKLFFKLLPVCKAAFGGKRASTASPTSSRHFRVSSITFSIIPRHFSVGLVSSRPSTTSWISSSFSSWVDARNRTPISTASSRPSIDIDESVCRRSLSTDPDRSRGIDARVTHPRPSQDTHGSELNNCKYFDVTLAAGSEATNRRRRKADSLANSVPSSD